MGRASDVDVNRDINQVDQRLPDPGGISRKRRIDYCSQLEGGESGSLPMITMEAAEIPQSGQARQHLKLAKSIRDIQRPEVLACHGNAKKKTLSGKSQRSSDCLRFLVPGLAFLSIILQGALIFRPMTSRPSSGMESGTYNDLAIEGMRPHLNSNVVLPSDAILEGQRNDGHRKLQSIHEEYLSLADKHVHWQNKKLEETIANLENKIMTLKQELLKSKKEREAIELEHKKVIGEVSLPQYHVDTVIGPDSISENITRSFLSSRNESVFPSSMNRLVTEMGTVSRREFYDAFDTGYALDVEKVGNEQVLLLYSSKDEGISNSGHPKKWVEGREGILREMSVNDAKEQCNAVKVVLTDPTPDKNDCIAIMGQWSSYHVQKFEREDKMNSEDWEYVPGRNTAALLPTPQHLEANRRLLLKYLTSYPAAMAKLKPIAELASRGGSVEGKRGPITVLLSNYGQADFLTNYVCSARARDIDLSRVLVFATDHETETLSKSMNLATFYDEEIFGLMPSDAAKTYHDINYGLIMLSKIYSVHMVNALGHDILFSDVDIALYRDPVQYFEERAPPNFDMYFQHDGFHHPKRFARFYFVRNNERTRHFFNVFVRMGDYVLKENSHQAALTTLINEHMSLHGLRVKVLGPNKFISGYHYHHESKLMKRIKQGKHSAYMFHANWLPGEEKMPVLTEYHNRFLKDECMAKSIDELLDSTGNILGGCCLSHPYKEVISSDEDERDEPFSDGIGLDSK